MQTTACAMWINEICVQRVVEGAGDSEGLTWSRVNSPLFNEPHPHKYFVIFSPNLRIIAVELPHVEWP